MLKNLSIRFHQLMVVMVTPDLLNEGNKTLGYQPKVSTLTKSQHQLRERIKERKLIAEKTINHHPHKVILVEIPTQMTMTIMIRTKMEAMARAGEAEVRNAMLEEHRFQEMLLPVLVQCWNLCKVLVLHSDQ